MTEDVNSDSVVAYTDGACAGNPGPGGWGVVLSWNGKRKTLSGGHPRTTNNAMELMAAIQALETLRRPMPVDVYTDSRYVRDGITAWIKRWKQNGWRTADGREVKNASLWRRLDEAMRRHRVNWHWVPGHAGVAENELADRIAREAIPKPSNMEAK